MKKAKLTLLLLSPVLVVPFLTQCGAQKDPDTISIAVVADTAEYKTMMNFVNKYKAIPLKVLNLIFGNFNNWKFFIDLK